MNASSQTLMRIPQIEWSGELLSVSFRLFRVSSHLPCLFELAKLLICIFLKQLGWCRTGFANLIKGKGKGEKLLKVGRKRKKKERKKDKEHTNSIARIRARASRPAVSFSCLKLHHAAKTTNTRYEYYVTNNHTTHRLTKKHSVSHGFKWK